MIQPAGHMGAMDPIRPVADRVRTGPARRPCPLMGVDVGLEAGSALGAVAGRAVVSEAGGVSGVGAGESVRSVPRWKET